jgi:hypothetical protein
MMPLIIVSNASYQAGIQAYGASEKGLRLPTGKWLIAVTDAEIAAAAAVMLPGETYSELILRGAKQRLMHRGDGPESIVKPSAQLSCDAGWRRRWRISGILDCAWQGFLGQPPTPHTTSVTVPAHEKRG